MKNGVIKIYYYLSKQKQA